MILIICIRLIQIKEYPEESVFIRKGHGFFIRGNEMENVMNTFANRIVPYMNIRPY